MLMPRHAGPLGVSRAHSGNHGVKKITKGLASFLAQIKIYN